VREWNFTPAEGLGTEDDTKIYQVEASQCLVILFLKGCHPFHLFFLFLLPMIPQAKTMSTKPTELRYVRGTTSHNSIVLFFFQHIPSGKLT
jgi:hypothetical protein